MTPRYALHPGPVRSANDGTRHYVNAIVLARLYHLQPGQYVVWTGPSAGQHWENFIHLYPRYDGRYDLRELQP